jgi:hypothetical protein
MFIRKRQSSRRPSYQIIQTYREDGKVKQRVIANLRNDSTLQEAIDTAQAKVTQFEQALIRIQQRKDTNQRSRSNSETTYRYFMNKYEYWQKQLDTLCSVKEIPSA